MDGMGLGWMRPISIAGDRVCVLVEHGTTMETARAVDHVLQIRTFPPHAEGGLPWDALHARRVVLATA
jgi:hypothetical protein